MKTWLLIAVLAVGTVLLKATGPLLAGGRQPPESFTRVIALLAPALITALVIAGTFTKGHTLTIDARAAGVAVGAAALWFRAPPVLALVLAAASALLLRAIT